MSITEQAAEGCLPNAARREQTKRELDRVKKAFDAWFSMRNERDKDLFGQYAGLHKTRLTTLQGVLSHAVDSLCRSLGQIDVSATRGSAQVYAECRAIDHAIVWMQRVWLFYRDKFDQREDKSLLPLLQAADEVIWSCYRQVFTNKNNFPETIKPGPAPLAYIDAQYSPATWEAAKPAPSELRAGSAVEGLSSFLQTLPVPVLRLPTWCIGAPWFLVFIAHEVGHNIQRELDLIASVKSLIAEAFQRPGLDPSVKPDRWLGWGEEIFADLFSVAMMGHWAARALREILVGPPDEMTRPQAGYPLPVIRLALLANATGKLGFDAPQALGTLDLKEISKTSPIATFDMQMVEPVVDKLLGPLSKSIASLQKLCGVTEFRTDLPGRAQHWRGELKGKPAAPTRSLQAARFIACGAWQAWEDMAASTTATANLDDLAASAVDSLRKSGPEGERAEPPKPAEVEASGIELAELCLAAGREEVGPSGA